MKNLENTYALVIGIANYHHINPLPATVRKDALDIHDLLANPEMGSYDHMKILLDGDATRQAILDELAGLAKRCDADSTLFLYVSSHGGRIESGLYAGEYLLPVDVSYTSDQALAETAISDTVFTEMLRAIPARKVIVILDCCHSAGIGEPKNAVQVLKAGLSEQYYQALASGRGRVVFAASREDEPAWVMPGDSNSLFTKHLLDGLRGGAPGPGAVIRIFDLFHYIQPLVTAEQPRQHPIFKAEVEENFPVACYPAQKIAPLISAPLKDDFSYDVFISYRHQELDKTWTRKILVPRLEAEDLRVLIDYKSFRIGAPLVEEMQRAVLESRYTLAILSPAYLSSNFTEIENIMAQHLGLEAGQHRLLSIIRQDCSPKLRMRISLVLDMTEDEEFEMNVARLIYQLRQSPDK